MDFDGDAFTTWLEDHGENPDNWPLPEGQAMTWDEWAKALSAEAVKCEHSPDIFPWSAEDRRDMALTCWFEDWFCGKAPADVIQDQKHR